MAVAATTVLFLAKKTGLEYRKAKAIPQGNEVIMERSGCLRLGLLSSTRRNAVTDHKPVSQLLSSELLDSVRASNVTGGLSLRAVYDSPDTESPGSTGR
jgi:hypothetical protein